MRWTLDWLTKHGGLNNAQQEVIRTIYQHNDSLINLISDLLVLSKMDTVQAQDEKIDLIQEINVIIDDVKRRNPKVSFSFETGGSVVISSNKSLVIQVFSNLISNAAEYSDKTAGNVRVVLKSEETHYIFSVENNGTSIPLEDQSKIFSKFFRASNASEIKKSGTGLGLFIVKTICDDFGWQVRFQSPLPNGDQGTIFFVRIPVREEKESM